MSIDWVLLNYTQAHACVCMCLSVCVSVCQSVCVCVHACSNVLSPYLPVSRQLGSIYIRTYVFVEGGYQIDLRSVPKWRMKELEA